jgi:hypothetical protein
MSHVTGSVGATWGATYGRGGKRKLGLLGLLGAPHVACDRKRRGYLGLPGATSGHGEKRKLGLRGLLGAPHVACDRKRRGHPGPPWGISGPLLVTEKAKVGSTSFKPSKNP